MPAPTTRAPFSTQPASITGVALLVMQTTTGAPRTASSAVSAATAATFKRSATSWTKASLWSALRLNTRNLVTGIARDRASAWVRSWNPVPIKATSTGPGGARAAAATPVAAPVR